MEAGGNIVLTDAGLAKAQEVLERHKVLTRFFAEHIAYLLTLPNMMPAALNM